MVRTALIPGLMLVTIPALYMDNNPDGRQSPETTASTHIRDIRAAASGQLVATGLRCLLKFRPASANLERTKPAAPARSPVSKAVPSRIPGRLHASRLADHALAPATNRPTEIPAEVLAPAGARGAHAWRPLGHSAITSEPGTARNHPAPTNSTDRAPGKTAPAAYAS